MAARLFPTHYRDSVLTYLRLKVVLLGGFVFALAGFTATPITRAQLSNRSGSLIYVSPLVAKPTVLSATDGAKEISIVLVFPLKHPTEAAEFAERVSTPMDPLYGKFLTPQEFADTYGADEADYAAVRAWATANQLKISAESISRTTLAVRGTVTQFEALFNAHLKNYRSPKGDEFYSAESKPIVPAAIASKVMGIIGLTNSRQYAPLARVYKTFGEKPAAKAVTDVGGTGPGGAFSPSDLQNVYGILLGGELVKQTVAVFEQGGYAPSDVAKYRKTFALPDVPVKPRLVNGYGGGINDPGVELEAVLDIDLFIGIDPAVKQVLVYEDGDDPFGVALLDSLSAVADDNLAQCLSISYGLDEALQGNTQIAAEGQVLTQLAAQGIAVFASAGDDGAYGDSGIGLNVSDPASQPDVTGIGGTTLFTTPNKKGTPIYVAEEVWNLLGFGLGATGGGVSSVWPIPDWQNVANATANGGSATYRNIPDLTAVGDPTTGVAIYSAINGGWQQVGGTSVSSPLWGAYYSFLNAGRKGMGIDKFGFFNLIMSNLFLHQYLYPALDITDGTNGNLSLYGIPGYSAGNYYDNCSGWGTINNVLTLPVYLTIFTKKGNPPAVPTNVNTAVKGKNVLLTWTASPGALGYFILLGSSVAQGTGEINGPLEYVTKNTSVEITGLPAKGSFLAYVAAVNNAGSAATPFIYLPPVP